MICIRPLPFIQSEELEDINGPVKFTVQSYHPGVIEISKWFLILPGVFFLGDPFSMS